MLALAIQRRLARGTTTDEEIDALVTRFARDVGVIFTVGTLEYLQKGGRIGRAQALAGTLLNVKPILAIRGRRGRSGRARPRPTEGARGVRAVFVEATRDEPGLRVVDRARQRPGVGRRAHRLRRKASPHAEIELVETLGAVVGTHAGPGRGRVLLVPGRRPSV